MRVYLCLVLLAIACFASAATWAVVATQVNISKENGYAIVHTPSAKAMITKENAYAVVKPPSAKAQISKLNAYAIVQKNYPPVFIMGE
jgi:hypothetical protein